KASVEPAIVRVARTTGEAFAWNSQNINIDTTDTLLSIQNQSPTKDLVIDRFIFCAGDVSHRFEVFKITADYTPTGTAVPGVALGPRGGAGTTSAVAKSDETGVDQVAANVFMEVSLLALTPIEVKCGMVLGGGVGIGVDQIGEGTLACCIAFGYFVDRK
ncbi:hypothetical protein LCGC14_3051030, partial [marine sediment metagenome]